MQVKFYFIKQNLLSKTISEMRVKPQAYGGRNSSPLIRNGKGEEIVCTRFERKCMESTMIYILRI